MRIVLICLLLVSNLAFGCAVLKPGAGYSLEDLIDKSETIVLVQLESKETNEHGDLISFLKVVDTVKGEPASRYEFWTIEDKHENASFLDHNDAGFWFNDIGRSPWYCCVCGPDHTFADGQTYLYFPDLLGAMKSAEIIKTQEDRWLKFVKRRVSESDS
jgi:hypothetical protein